MIYGPGGDIEHKADKFLLDDHAGGATELSEQHKNLWRNVWTAFKKL